MAWRDYLPQTNTPPPQQESTGGGWRRFLVGETQGSSFTNYGGLASTTQKPQAPSISQQYTEEEPSYGPDEISPQRLLEEQVRRAGIEEAPKDTPQQRRDKISKLRAESTDYIELFGFLDALQADESLDFNTVSDEFSYAIGEIKRQRQQEKMGIKMAQQAAKAEERRYDKYRREQLALEEKAAKEQQRLAELEDKKALDLAKTETKSQTDLQKETIKAGGKLDLATEAIPNLLGGATIAAVNKEVEKVNKEAEFKKDLEKRYGKDFVDSYDAIRVKNPTLAWAATMLRAATERGEQQTVDRLNPIVSDLLRLQRLGDEGTAQYVQAMSDLQKTADALGYGRASLSSITFGLAGRPIDKLIEVVSGTPQKAEYSDLEKLVVGNDATKEARPFETFNIGEYQSGIGKGAATAVEIATGLGVAGRAIAGATKVLPAATTTVGAVAQRAGVQATVGAVQSTANSLNAVARGEMDAGEAKANILSGIVSSAIAAPVAAAVPGKLKNAVAQVTADLMVDLASDAVFTDYLKDKGFVKWFLERELPNLVVSAAGAGLDLKGAYQQKKAIRDLVKDGLTRTINLDKGGGIPREVPTQETAPEASRQALAQQRLEEESVQMAKTAEELDIAAQEAIKRGEQIEPSRLLPERTARFMAPEKGPAIERGAVPTPPRTRVTLNKQEYALTADNEWVNVKTGVRVKGKAQIEKLNNLAKVPLDETQVTPKQETANAIPIRETAEVPVGERAGGRPEVDEGVRIETPAVKTEDQVKAEAEVAAAPDLLTPGNRVNVTMMEGGGTYTVDKVNADGTVDVVDRRGRRMTVGQERVYAVGGPKPSGKPPVTPELPPAVEGARPAEAPAPVEGVPGYKAGRDPVVSRAAELGLDTKGTTAEIQARISKKEKVLSFLDGVEQGARERLTELGKTTTLGANKPAGMAVEYTIIGAAKVAKGVVKFADWSREMVAEFGEAIRPYLRGIYQRALTINKKEFNSPEEFRSYSEKMAEGLKLKTVDVEAIKPPDGMKMRQTAARMPTDLGYAGKEVPIAKEEAVYYKPKTIDEIGAENPNVASFAKAIKERKPIDEVLKLADPALKEVGSAAQLMRYMREMYDSTPEGIVISTQAAAKKAGVELPPKASADLTSAAEKSINTRNAAKIAQEAFAKDPTPENKRAAEVAEAAAYKADIDVQNLQHKYVPLDPWDVAIQSMRMGVMKPASLLANLWGNIVVRPTATIPTQIIASAIDKIRSIITKKPREITMSWNAVKKETSAFINAIKREIPGIYKYGFSEEQAKVGEQFRGLKPIQAARQIKAGDYSIDPKTGKPLTSDKIARYMEAILGGPAEAIGRSLAAGDVPFKRSAKARRLAEQAKLLNVPVERVEEVLRTKYPKRLEQIERETLGEVYQEPNIVSKAISSFWNHVRAQRGGKAIEFASRATGAAPMFVQTPVNVVKELVNYGLGPLTVGRGIAQVARGNTRSGELTIAKGIVGSMYHLAALWILQNAKEAVTGSPAKAKEERELQYSTVGPYKLNVTGLSRALAGGSATPQDGDRWVDYSKAGYIGGVLAINKEIWDQDQKRIAEGENPTEIWGKAGQVLLETTRFGLNMTFAQGTSVILDALTSGEPEKMGQWGRNVERALLSTVAPATLEDVGKTMREYMPEKRSAEPSASFANVIKDRFSFLGFTDDLPPRRGLFGEPVRQTPAGENPIIYHLVNTIKTTSGKIPEHYRELDALYKRTYDLAVIPNVPKRTIVKTVGGKQITYQLNDQQWDRLQQLVGEARMRLYELRKPMGAATDNLKIKNLERIYREGSEIGTQQFMQEFVNQLETKSEKEVQSGQGGKSGLGRGFDGSMPDPFGRGPF